MTEGISSARSKVAREAARAHLMQLREERLRKRREQYFGGGKADPSGGLKEPGPPSSEVLARGNALYIPGEPTPSCNQGATLDHKPVFGEIEASEEACAEPINADDAASISTSLDPALAVGAVENESTTDHFELDLVDRTEPPAPLADIETERERVEATSEVDATNAEPFVLSAERSGAASSLDRSAVDRDCTISGASGTLLEDSPLMALPGAGPGLVWMLNQCEIQSLAELAAADADSLSAQMGLVGQVLDMRYLIRLAGVLTTGSKAQGAETSE